MTDTPWWRHAVIYQVYLRSFADGDGDGIGDLAGVRDRLGYLRELGVDALWFTPWYTSPMADGGYDVADYRAIDPVFGDLDQVRALLEEAHAHGLRVICDLVPNHCSDQHPWFRQALADPASPLRHRFWFRPGRGEHGELPPNDWPSQFGGDAWTRTTNPDGSPGEWYLHLFTPEQPDLNWEHPAVRAEFEDILRFWLKLGVDGFRVDVAVALAKKPGLPDQGADPDPLDLPYQDQPQVHEIYRSWRRVLEEFPDRAFVGEVWLPNPEGLADYLRPDELHTAFNFDFLCCAWDPAALREVVEGTLAVHATVAAPPTWVLCNHDTIRQVTRYGRADTSFDIDHRRLEDPADTDLGRRRSRAAALLSLALPGSAYVYQGDELGLPEVRDLPDELRQDPTFQRSGGQDRGRDGCRVPLPWTTEGPSLGYSTAPPWLPQPPDWAALSVQAQRADPESMLSLYRTALALRREHLTDESLTWLDLPADALGFERTGGFRCVVNLGPADLPLPPHNRVLLASGPLRGGALPTDTAVWLA
ncbi:alpha-glucosidase [Crossiella equi]|uniref:Alpha-glucosidase n=1 Tax=Crossiella equi TaxID=130796 RepID=A0ABS5AQE6_9PSEU|nr:glycoside hydrolase family 13 protein [Crossiella equi]MBP2478775.1 alpha-glucosidase [Crossiella equi]